MKIPSNYTNNLYINRYQNINRLFQNQNQQDSLVGVLNTFRNNYYSPLSNEKLRQNYAELGNQAKTLELNQAKNIFEQTKAVATVGDSKVVAAEAKNGAAAASFDLEVAQIAKAQENTGDWVEAGNKNLALNGSQSFAINLTGQSGFVAKTEEFTIQTNTGETNKSVLGKMAEAINNRKDLGVSARLETTTENGVEKARLIVSGNQTGLKSNQFSITDTSGNLVAQSKIDQVTTNAQNAKYQLNGRNYESQTNKITLDWRSQVTATLKNTTKPGEAVKVNVKPQDQNALYDKVQDFINQYNQTVKAFGPTNNVGLTGIATRDRGKLASIGININRDNTLEINEDRFKRALTYDADKVQNIIGGQNGLAAKIEAKTKEVPQVDMSSNINQFLYSGNPNRNNLGSLFDFYI